jgi:hypothetical protein
MGAMAVLGWGSLIWCPGILRTKSRWHSDGPALPIEFVRISGDNCLTLVIHPGSPEQTTYWAVSECESLAEARKNLRMREGIARSTSTQLRRMDRCKGTWNRRLYPQFVNLNSND